jgi:hypothetical protein
MSEEELFLLLMHSSLFPKKDAKRTQKGRKKDAKRTQKVV